jgi:hypothetical protein
MKTILSILIVLLLICPVFAQNQVIEPIQPKKGVFSGLLATVMKYWMWLLVAIVGAIIVVFIIMLVKRMKQKVDPFKEDYKKVRSLCKFTKDTTIKQVYLVGEKNLNYMGKYLGSAITQDGYINILLWKNKRWYLFWIPIFLDFFDLVKEDFIIRCNLNKLYKYKFRNQEGQEEIKTIELDHDIVYKDGDKMIIRGVGIERVRYFFYPVLRDKDGNVVDKKLEVFARERDSALMETMYSQVEDFANVSRELINISPSVRYFQKVGSEIGKKPD